MDNRDLWSLNEAALEVLNYNFSSELAVEGHKLRRALLEGFINKYKDKNIFS